MEVSYFSVIGALEGQVYYHSGGQVIVRRGRVASLEMMFYFFQRVSADTCHCIHV